MEVAVDVGGKREVEPLVGDVLDACRVLLEGGVVDEHVEAAEGLYRLGDGAVAELRVLDVAGDEQAAPAFGLDAHIRLLGVAVRLQIDDRNVGAFAREEDGDGPADAGIAAGDDGRKALELATAAVVGRHELRRELQVGFAARLGLVLRRQLVGLPSSAGLHPRSGLLRALVLVGGARIAGVLRALDASLGLARRDGAPRARSVCPAQDESLLRLGGRRLDGNRRALGFLSSCRRNGADAYVRSAWRAARGVVPAI